MREYTIRMNGDGTANNVFATFHPDSDTVLLQFDDDDPLVIPAMSAGQEYSDETIQIARLATAAERIADALEAARDDTQYEYIELSRTKDVNEKQAEGYRLLQIVQWANEDGAEPGYIMRRPVPIEIPF